MNQSKSVAPAVVVLGVIVLAANGQIGQLASLLFSIGFVAILFLPHVLVYRLTQVFRRL